MRTCALTITPLSPFGTPLKGDTLFGHVCWQAAEDPALLDGGLERWVGLYPERPFAVFSSAFPLLPGEDPLVVLPRPQGHGSEEGGDRRQRFERRKEGKKRKYLLVPGSLSLARDQAVCATEAEVFDRFVRAVDRDTARQLRLLPAAARNLAEACEQSHNTINRLTMTTGTGPFAPFSHENFSYLPGLRLVLYVAIDEEALDFDRLRLALERIGAWGFGRDASTGLGRFLVDGLDEVAWPEWQPAHAACYTLAPCVPEKRVTARCLATPFTRFGRHGAALAVAGQPYKNPVVMADEGALLFMAGPPPARRPYLGTGLAGLSKADQRTIAQGYALYLPY